MSTERHHESGKDLASVNERIRSVGSSKGSGSNSWRKSAQKVSEDFLKMQAERNKLFDRMTTLVVQRHRNVSIKQLKQTENPIGSTRNSPNKKVPADEESKGSIKFRLPIVMKDH